jgi:hypothetical protein
VERNLGFEAEHMERALRDEPNVLFYKDIQAGRTGVWTTENVKLGAMTLTNVMLRESRVHLTTDKILISQVNNIKLLSFSIFFLVITLIIFFMYRIQLQLDVD